MQTSYLKTADTTKIFLIILLTTFCTARSIAQKRISYGAEASGGMYWISGDSKTTNGANKIGYSYGALFEFHMTDKCSLISGLGISSISAAGKTTETVASTSIFTPSTTAVITVDNTTNYLQIPLLLKMKTKQRGHFKYFVQAGFGTGFALSTKNSNSYPTTINVTIPGLGTSFPISTTNTSSDTDMGNVNQLRQSVIGGLGIELNLIESTTVIVGLNYDNALTPVLREQNGPSGYKNGTMMSKGVMLNVGIVF